MKSCAILLTCCGLGLMAGYLAVIWEIPFWQGFALTGIGLIAGILTMQMGEFKSKKRHNGKIDWSEK